MAKSCTRTGSGCPLGRNSRPPFLKSPTSSFFFVSTEITGCPAAWNAFTVAFDMLELSVAVGVAGTFARLAVGLQAEVEALQQAAAQLRTSDEAPLRLHRGT